MKHQIPCFVRLKSLKLDVGHVTIYKEKIIEMVAYLLQDSPPLVTIGIGRKAEIVAFRY